MKRYEIKAETDKRIFDAFEKLLGKYSSEEISIRMIADEANVSRQIIYKHFSNEDTISKELCKIQIDRLNNLIKEYKIVGSDPSQVSELAILVLGYIQENKNLFLYVIDDKLLNNKFTDFDRFIRDIIISSTNNFNDDENSQMTIYRNKYIKYGVHGIIKEWLHSENPIPVEELAQFLLLFSGIWDNIEINQ